MIQIGEYTKEQMAVELELTATRDGSIRADTITRKLKKLGYRFSTIGKARNYRIYITALPQMGIKQFAEKYLGISARFEERLTHFLYLLFASGNAEQYANMSASSLEWHTYSNNDTIQDWLDSLIDCGLLLEEDLIEVYYATLREAITEPDINGNYQYTQYWKEIERVDYEKAIEAYNDRYSRFGDISKNPDVAADEAVYLANLARKEALDGWWAMRKRINFKIEINKAWPHYSELISLLENYQFVEYRKERTGNRIKEGEAWEKRLEQWYDEREAKKKRLEEEARKAATNRKVYEEAERKKKLAALEAEPLDYFEVIMSKPKPLGEEIVVGEGTGKEPWANPKNEAEMKLKEIREEMDGKVFEGAHDFLKYINDNYYKTGRWIHYDRKR